MELVSVISPDGKIYNTSLLVVKEKDYLQCGEPEICHYYSEGVSSFKCIVGQNGVGKTRLINSILSLDKENTFIFKDKDKFYQIGKKIKINNVHSIDGQKLQSKIEIIKFSSSIEVTNGLMSSNNEVYTNTDKKKFRGKDISTSAKLRTMNLNTLNRLDVLNQVAVAIDHYSTVSQLINFNTKKLTMQLSDQGAAIASLDQSFFIASDREIAKEFKDAGKTYSQIDKAIRYKYLSYVIDNLGTNNRELISKIDKERLAVPDEEKDIFPENMYVDMHCMGKAYEFLNGKNFLVANTNARKHSFLNKDEKDINPDILDVRKWFESKNELVREVFLTLNLEWDGLSSGELALLNLFGRLYDLIKTNKFENNKTVILLIDEVDLGLHPEWQRQWVDRVLKVIDQLFKDNNSKLQVIITTHSPIILSDIFKDDIIYLTNNDKDVPNSETFGQNIYTLFNNSFFLDSMQGDYSFKMISSLSKLITKLESTSDGITQVKALTDFFEEFHFNSGEDLVDKIELIEKMINNIGEKIIRTHFLSRISRIKWAVHDLKNDEREVENLIKFYEEKVQTLQSRKKKMN